MPVYNVFFFFFLPYHAAGGILVLQPGNWVLSTGPLEKSYVSVTSKTHVLPSPTHSLSFTFVYNFTT